MIPGIFTSQSSTVNEYSNWKTTYHVVVEKITFASHLPVSEIELMGERAFRLIEEKFSINNAVKAHIRLFQRVLQTTGMDGCDDSGSC